MLRSIYQRFSGRKARRASQKKNQSPRSKRPCRLEVEPLEQRVVPSFTVNQVVQQFQDGAQKVFQTLPGWSALADVDRFHSAVSGQTLVELPVVTDRLNSLFNVQQVVGQIATPNLPSSTTLADFRTQLENNGFTLDNILNGLPGVPASPAGDALQVHFVKNFQNLSRSNTFQGDPYNDATPGVLNGLASATGLDGTLTLGANLGVQLVMGVDSNGFYFQDTSQV